MTHKQLRRPQPQQEFSYYDNDNTHGKLVGNAQRTAKGQRLQPAPGERWAQEERKRDERLRARERGASVNSGASYDANRRAKQSRKHETLPPRGVNRRARARPRANADEREIYIGQLPALSHMLIVLKRGENEMQRNEWAAQNVRNKMETGT